MKLKPNFNLMLWLTGMWTAFTVALAGWWMVLGLRLVQIQFPTESEELLRYRRMLTQEGIVLILMLIVGGGALFVSLFILKRQNERIRSFFATFTHELKTPLTNLRIQTEILKENSKESNQASTIHRLAAEGVRLELQLENSLFLADAGQGPLFFEKIELKDLIENVGLSWSQLKVNLEGNALIHGDRRALEAIFRNLFQNAVYHGKSTEIQLLVQAALGKVQVTVSDNGQGFKGSAEQIGRLFDRTNSKSGTGVGLWLIDNLMHRMNGSSRHQVVNGRLQTNLQFQGELL